MLTVPKKQFVIAPFRSLTVVCPICNVVLDDGGTKPDGVTYMLCGDPDCQEKEKHSARALPAPESLKNK